MAVKALNKTLLYLTNNVLDEKIMSLCQRKLREAAGDNPIVSVSQKPIDLGRNVCVGEIGSSWLNIYKQQLAGLEVVDTEYVAIAEHDCLYTQEHFNWQPPDKETFWYNRNCWLVEWGGNHPELDGMYSYWARDRAALSQLICPRELLQQSVLERLHMIECGLRVLRRLGEPGAFPPAVVELARKATDGKADYLKGFFEEHVTKFTHKFFKSINPNLDIRHNLNFTGPRRGKQRRHTLPYWGVFAGVMESII